MNVLFIEIVVPRRDILTIFSYLQLYYYLIWQAMRHGSVIEMKLVKVIYLDLSFVVVGVFTV